MAFYIIVLHVNWLARFDVNSEETIGSKWWLGRDIFMERAVQHTYAPLDLSWTASPVLIRLECTPFGRGASRQAYRLKYLSAPSEGGGLGSEEDWERAAEHVVKSYNTDDGSIKGEEDGLALDHVRLQHEAAFWAPAFNAARRRALAAEEAAAVPVNVIPCTVLQLTARPSHPVVSCEQYFSGTTSGSSADFVIHGSDTMHTGPAASNPDPLAFFLFTFYASGGLSMVVHMEGVENTFTNPQVRTYINETDALWTSQSLVRSTHTTAGLGTLILAGAEWQCSWWETAGTRYVRLWGFPDFR